MRFFTRANKKTSLGEHDLADYGEQNFSDPNKFCDAINSSTMQADEMLGLINLLEAFDDSYQMFGHQQKKWTNEIMDFDSLLTGNAQEVRLYSRIIANHMNLLQKLTARLKRHISLMESVYILSHRLEESLQTLWQLIYNLCHPPSQMQSSLYPSSAN